MAQANVEVTAVAKEVVNAVRNDHAGSPTGEVMVQRAERLLCPYAALAEELPEMLFGLGIEGKYGVAHREVFGLQFRDPPELGVPIGAVPAFQNLLDLVSRQLLPFHPVLHDWWTDRCSHVRHHIRNLPRRQVRPEYVFLVGVSGSANLQNRFQILFEFRLGLDLFFRPAPGRRTRPAAGSVGNWSSSSAPRSMVRAEHPKTAATYSIPPYPNRVASSAAKRRRSLSDNVCQNSRIRSSTCGSYRF